MKLSSGFSRLVVATNALMITAALAVSGTTALAQVLGSATNYGVLAGATVTNTGATVITGNVGVSAGSAITGFPPGLILGGTQHSNDASAPLAQVDMFAAFTAINAEGATLALTGQDLGGLTLTPGVYFFSSSAQLTGCANA